MINDTDIIDTDIIDTYIIDTDIIDTDIIDTDQSIKPKVRRVPPTEYGVGTLDQPAETGGGDQEEQKEER